MALILFKWLFVAIVSTVPVHSIHPVFMSVTEIELNAKDKSLEISCKIFTDDFEKTLRKNHTQKIDLLDSRQKNAMNGIVNEYVQAHLKLTADGKPVIMNFLGFDQQEEGISGYFQVNGISNLKELRVTDNILYEYQSQQISFLHVTVNGNRQSTRLNNPDDHATFRF